MDVLMSTEYYLDCIIEYQATQKFPDDVHRAVLFPPPLKIIQ